MGWRCDESVLVELLSARYGCEVIPKEQNRSNEDLLMVGFTRGKRFLLRIGDGILRNPSWSAARRMRREYGRSQNPFPGLIEVTDEEKIRYIEEQKEKGIIKFDKSFVESLLPLDKRVENENVQDKNK